MLDSFMIWRHPLGPVMLLGIAEPCPKRNLVGGGIYNSEAVSVLL